VNKIVLCVDDSATMQQVADITFRGTEFTYVGARSYDDGLDKAKGQKPALVLADSQMPGHGKSGYDLCLALKSDPNTASIPVAILVGNSAPYDPVRGVQVGADANLPKPWDTATMLEKVTELVGKAASGVAKPGQVAVAAGAGAAVAAPAVPAAPVVPATAAAAKSAPAAATTSASMPPRSATIMGMPTIKMPAGNTQPMMTSSTSSGLICARSTAARIAAAPSSEAEKLLSSPCTRGMAFCIAMVTVGPGGSSSAVTCLRRPPPKLPGRSVAMVIESCISSAVSMRAYLRA